MYQNIFVLVLSLTLTSTLAPVAQAQHCHEPASEEGATEATIEASTETAAPSAGNQLEIPSVALLDQEGRPVDFRDLVVGKVVAMNFVFTTCTTVCPPMGANFGKLQQLLGSRAGREIHLISVSIDPAVDTPDRLRSWSRKFGAGVGWTLVTGTKPAVNGLLKDLGVFVADKQYHSPITLLGNESAGIWQRTNGLTPATELLRQLEGLAALQGSNTEEVAP